MGWTVAGNIRGPQGDTGPKGDTGDQGATGVQGATGASGLTWQGEYDPASAYSVDDAVGYLGASYFATAAHGAGDGVPPVPAERGTPNTGWALLASEGAVGATGAKGDTGDTGPAGAKGDTGDTGAQGSSGAQGAQGATGATGATGAQGAAGVRGSQWFTGTGAPGTIAGSQAGDQYLDGSTGTIYTLS